MNFKYHGLVPVKVHSTRLPGKNFYLLSPQYFQLWVYAVQHLFDCGVERVTVLTDKKNDFLIQVRRSPKSDDWLTECMMSERLDVVQESLYRNPDQQILIDRIEEKIRPELPLAWLYSELSHYNFDYLCVCTADTVNRPSVTQCRKIIQDVDDFVEYPIHEALLFDENCTKTNAFNIVSRQAILDNLVAGHSYNCGIGPHIYDLNEQKDLDRWNNENPNEMIFTQDEIDSISEKMNVHN